MSGCATTGTDGVVQIAPDTYMIGNLGRFTDFSGSAVKARLIKQAQDFCKKKGGVMKLIDSTFKDSGLGTYASAEIQFKCLSPDATGIDSDAPKGNQGVTSASGTCFAVHPDGWLITANHVIDDGKIFDVMFGNVLVRAEVIVRDKKHDLALLKVGVPTPHYLSIVENSDLRLGTDVYTLGYPLSGLLSQEIRFNKGTISALSSFKDPNESEGLYQVSVPVQPGNSGGPLMHDDGTVVGVVVSKVSDLFVLKSTGVLPQNISFAIDSDYIHELLITAGVALPPHIARSIEEASKATHLLIVE